MAIKGNGYIKTAWAFEERPVTASKLNNWDDQIEAGAELGFFLLSHGAGGGDGVVRDASTDDLKVTAASPVGMYVNVEPGYALIGNYPYKQVVQTATAAMVAPVTNPRIDLVQANLVDWVVSVKTGTESATPSAPSADADSIALGELYLRTAMTSIKDVDDSVNGYITDVREFV